MITDKMSYLMKTLTGTQGTLWCVFEVQTKVIQGHISKVKFFQNTAQYYILTVKHAKYYINTMHLLP